MTEFAPVLLKEPTERPIFTLFVVVVVFLHVSVSRCSTHGPQVALITIQAFSSHFTLIFTFLCSMLELAPALEVPFAGGVTAPTPGRGALPPCVT